MKPTAKAASCLGALVISLGIVMGCAGAPATTPQAQATAMPTASRIPAATPMVSPTASRAPAATPMVSPTASRIPAATLTATSALSPVRLEVASYTSYESFGALYFVGEVLNKGDAPVADVQVAVSLLDGQGHLLAGEATNLADIGVVPANGRYPFRLLLTEPPADWQEAKIQLQAAPFVPNPALPVHMDLRLEGATGQPPSSGFGPYCLSGQVVNGGQVAAREVKVVGVAYDPDGHVLDVADTFATLDEIQPGAAAGFRLEFNNLTQAPARWGLLAQGRGVTR